jgi:acyl carrier protein
MGAVFDKVREHIAACAADIGHPLEIPSIKKTFSLQADCFLDEIAQMELILSLEDAYSTDIPDEEMKTVGDLVSFLEKSFGKG